MLSFIQGSTVASHRMPEAAHKRYRSKLESGPESEEENSNQLFESKEEGAGEPSKKVRLVVGAAGRVMHPPSLATLGFVAESKLSQVQDAPSDVPQQGHHSSDSVDQIGSSVFGSLARARHLGGFQSYRPLREADPDPSKLPEPRDISSEEPSTEGYHRSSIDCRSPTVCRPSTDYRSPVDCFSLIDCRSPVGRHPSTGYRSPVDGPLPAEPFQSGLSSLLG